MSATPFRTLGWAPHEVITRDKMEQLQSNYQWIADNRVRGRFYGNGQGKKTTDIILLAGKVRIPRNLKSDTATVSVSFGAAFSSECRPVVTTGVVSDGHVAIFCTVHGLGDMNIPDSRGMEVTINIKAELLQNDKISKEFFVDWHALGFRST